MPDEVIATVRSMEGTGKTQFDGFVGQRIKDTSVNFYDSISKNNLPLFKSKPKKTPGKSEAKITPQRPHDAPKGEVRIFDGAALVHHLEPKKCNSVIRTFGDYAQKQVLPYIARKLNEGTVMRVDVVWDTYRTDSLKEGTRLGRGTGIPLHVTEQTSVPRNWSSFLPAVCLHICCVWLAGCVAMATKHNPDPNNPTSKEGKRMALELKHEHMLAEAKKAAEERKRARSVGDTLQYPKRDCVGRGKPRGRRGGRRQGSATVTSPPTEGFQSSSVEKRIWRLSDILSSCPPPEPQKSSASSWSFRQQKASECWKEARPHHLQCLLEKEAVGHPLCGLCHEPAVIRSGSVETDVLHQKKQPLHNRDSLMNGFFKPISPTTCVVRVEGGYDTHDQGRYDLHLPLYVCQTCQQQWTPDLKVLLKSGYWPASVSISTLYTLDLLSSFEELKVISPGFSRQAFAKLLEHRTKCGGRSGPVNGDALQRSFLEFSYASYEEDQLCCGAPFICPACTPEMLAVSADGNRKLYRFRRSGRCCFYNRLFNGLFVAEDSVTQGRGTCGDSQWTAARETSRRASKLDEEGMEVAVCRHGFLLKALNMYRGEIFAYPLYLQKELMPAKAKFFAMDVACKYWPYMEKAASVLPALQELTTMKPFLSVMHARAHATKCEIKWSGKNQEGAGMTAGEEVEQVNSYLSRCALTTKYMSKAGEWKTSKRLLEETASLEELKTELHCVSDDMVSTWISDVKEWASDSSKLRHRLRRKLADDKKRLNQEILKYNQLVHDSARGIDVAAVEHSLSGGSIMSALWPWEVHGMAKKKILDQVMLTRRLQEEKGILLLEMAQHCTWLQNMAVALKNKVAEEDVDKGNGGLGCTLRRKHSESSERLQVVLQQYKTALGPDASFLQHEEESQSGLSSPDTSEDEEGNII
ncbi:hypothetical protein F7725_020140 [Dissostichus mawsoni]|uniref:CxC3 like cysteine cluster domain-containing protein n=1 Tax=Dissostichus mawsoni TaxID=36200 RepID=A0A7J5YCC4_DISMA|nr:hypothetical protein F7725_020140 [Dissostichus mawsoni]